MWTIGLLEGGNVGCKGVYAYSWDRKASACNSSLNANRPNSSQVVGTGTEHELKLSSPYPNLLSSIRSALFMLVHFIDPSCQI